MNAIVTGATKGIGRAITIKLAEQGYNIAICARSLADLEALSGQLAYTGVQIFAMAADCSIKSEIYSFCDYAAGVLKDIDVLVNNTGIFLPSSIFDESDEAFEVQQNLNINCAYYLSKYIGKMMIHRRSGHIFNICSVASKEVIENAGSYSVTKSALLSLNNVLRQELAKYNVKVTAILPGSTLTSSWEGTTIPEEKFVQPEDIASTLYHILGLSTGANVDELIIKPIYF